ncbi:MAG: dihydropteroate synthase [Bacteroidales bacterium]|nr:dihydropteroate synthase [Bacteroidales bacterium]
MDNNAGRNIRIMGIVNITGDSFFAGSRMLASDGRLDEAVFRRRVEGMLVEGADILDFGACSTRPGSEPVSEEEEWSRLEPALRIIAREYPEICLSVDTFRPGIVQKVYDLAGGFIVNDISGGCDAMWELLGELKLPYVAMHMRGTPATMSGLTDYPDGVTAAVMDFFEGIRTKAEEHGVEDWILDPGFGFAKTVEQNWQLLREMSVFQTFGRPVLAGLSRKSFLYKPLGITPGEALPATGVANFIALRNGADILRVHDVKEARETVRLYGLYMG